MIKQVTVIFCLFILTILLPTGCSSRYETPVIEQDSTIVYLPKNADDINAQITFCEKISNKTGKLINEGTIFTIKDDAKVQALVELENVETNNNRELLFHLDWIEPDGNSFYRKKIELPPNDSSSIIMSSISIPPGKRQPGNYLFQVYLFRELIAEKKFILNNADTNLISINTVENADSIKASITLCRKISKKSGKLIDAGTVFVIKDKANIYAVVNLENRNVYQNKNLKFNAEWIGPDSNSFYRKKILLTPKDITSTITSSVSISPEKRQPGNYIFKIYLFDKLLAKKNFVLKREDKKLTVNGSKEIPDSIKAKVTLCKKVSKKTGKLIDAGTVFTIKDKANVYAVINLGNRTEYQNKNLKFYADWIGPNDSSFYRKKIELTPEDSSSTITSSISIAPGKREPGNYKFRIYLSRKLLAEEKFELTSEEKDSIKVKP